MIMQHQKKQFSGQTSLKRCGCYVRSLIEPIGPIKTDGMMPLKSSEYEIEMVNAVANVTLLQTYQNPTEKYLEVQYCFPVNPKACVYRLVATFGNKRSQGIVKQKNQAEKEYKQAIKSGKQAALAKYDSENSDIINLQVGNVAPNQIVKIEIVYLQELSLSSNMFYELHMTGTIYPRYMAQIPHEVLFRGFRDKAIQAKGEFYWDFTIKLRTSKKVIFAQSKSHKIVTVAQNDTRTECEFTLEKECLPTKDFVFTYTTENFQQPSYVLGRTDLSSTAMISFIPKFCQLSLDDAYQASLAGTPYQTDIQHARGQYIFLLDRSGSMRGKRIQKAKQALILFIKSLPQDVYFNVVSFGNQSQRLFVKSEKYNNKQIDFAVNTVKNMSADMGGTEIYTPLASLLKSKPIQGYPKHIFLLTDGDVSDTNFILEMVESNIKYSRVHTIGIGDGASQELVLGCAEKGKGHHVFISDDQNPSEKIIQLLTDSLSPVISKVNLQFDDNVVQSIIPNPKSIPYFLKQDLANFYINFRGQLTKKTSITFSYEDSLNKHPYSSVIQIDPESPSESFIDRMGHFKKIQLLEESLRKNDNIEEWMYYYVKKMDKRSEIVNLSIKHQILSSQTAFIFVEKELVDGKYQEIKATGQLKAEINNQPQYKQSMWVFKSLTKKDQKKKQQTMQPQMKQAMKAPTSTLASSSMGSRPTESRDYKNVAIIIGSCRKPQQKWKRMEVEEKKKQILKLSMKRQMRMPQKQKRVIMKQCMQQQYQGSFIPNKELKSEKQEITIDNVVSSQLSDGSWKDIKLAEALFGAEAVQKLLSQPFNIDKFSTELMVTCLIISWIEKYHPSKQYSLVVKKGMNFLKRELTDIEPLLSYCKNVKI